MSGYMQPNFSGLCVGGPMDGKSLVNEAEYFYAAERLEPPAFTQVVPPRRNAVETTTYRHVVAVRYNEGSNEVFRQALWLPEDVTLPQAMAEIFRHYHLGDARSKLSEQRLKGAIRSIVEGCLPITLSREGIATEITEAISSLFAVGGQE